MGPTTDSARGRGRHLTGRTRVLGVHSRPGPAPPRDASRHRECSLAARGHGALPDEWVGRLDTRSRQSPVSSTSPTARRHQPSSLVSDLEMHRRMPSEREACRGVRRFNSAAAVHPDAAGTRLPTQSQIDMGALLGESAHRHFDTRPAGTSCPSRSRSDHPSLGVKPMWTPVHPGCVHPGLEGRMPSSVPHGVPSPAGSRTLPTERQR